MDGDLIEIRGVIFLVIYVYYGCKKGPEIMVKDLQNDVVHTLCIHLMADFRILSEEEKFLRKIEQ